MVEATFLPLLLPAGRTDTNCDLFTTATPLLYKFRVPPDSPFTCVLLWDFPFIFLCVTSLLSFCGIPWYQLTDCRLIHTYTLYLPSQLRYYCLYNGFPFDLCVLRTLRTLRYWVSWVVGVISDELEVVDGQRFFMSNFCFMSSGFQFY